MNGIVHTDRRDYAVREVTAEEAPPAPPAPVLMRLGPGPPPPRPYFAADKDAPVEAFMAEADRHPVFALLPIHEDRPNGDGER